MKKPKVSIIIVNWNGEDVLKDCLNSLSKIDYSNYEIIIVDNGSQDPPPKSKSYKVIINKTNLGFAGGNNIGTKIAKGKYVLLLNNDTTVTPNFLSLMVDRMEKDPTVGVVQPKIYMMDKKGYLDNAGSFITKTGFLSHWGYGKKDGKAFEIEKEIFSGKGACLLIRKSIIDKVRLFDDDYISYFEDSDFCWKVWLIGSRVLFFPNASINHKVGYTNKRLDIFSINYHSIKNRISTLFKNLSFSNLFLILIPHVVILLTLSFYYLVRLQINKALMIWKAIFWNLTHFKKLLVRRKKIQKLRTVSDKEIFNKVGGNFNLEEMFSHFKKVEANFHVQ